MKTSNSSNIAFFSKMSSYHQVMITIEASSKSLLFKQFLVRIQATSLAIHKQMCSKILDNVDEIVVEPRLVAKLLMLTVQFVINVWCKLL